MRVHLCSERCPRGQFGWGVDVNDARTLGVYAGREAATARFSTPGDAREADALVTFLTGLLEGSRVNQDGKSWEPLARPAREPQALAEAFEEARAMRAGAGEETVADVCHYMRQEVPAAAGQSIPKWKVREMLNEFADRIEAAALRAERLWGETEGGAE